MNFRQAALLGSCISKDYAEDLFRLLATYTSISVSEAASRLNLHINTVQDFMEAIFELGFLEREEVYEKKRPYFRYRLKVNRIVMELDLNLLIPAGNGLSGLDQRIREKKNAGARFTTSRDNTYISSVAIWSGQDRNRTERRINLSTPQGKFLFHLPFPGAEPMTIASIMQKAGVEQVHNSEILDIVRALKDFDVIDEA
jgi:DNA-binding Lrp family transcriptional regulator